MNRVGCINESHAPHLRDGLAFKSCLSPTWEEVSLFGHHTMDQPHNAYGCTISGITA